MKLLDHIRAALDELLERARWHFGLGWKLA